MHIGLIGLGHIGGALAHRLLCHEGHTLSVYDIGQDRVRGKALDLCQGALLAGRSNPQVHVAECVSDVMACDLVVITAGQARQPGMTRQDLAHRNACIIQDIAHQMRGFAGITIVVTNPVDIMTYLFFQGAGCAPDKVMGMAGALDTARWIQACAQALSVEPGRISGVVLGPHNDQMIPIRSAMKCDGQPVSEVLCPPSMWNDIQHATRQGGATIVQLLGTGSAYYGPAEAIAAMIRDIQDDTRQVRPCSVLLQGHYGVQDLCCGVPVVLGRAGVVAIAHCPLSQEEQVAWDAGVTDLRAALQQVACA